jgi:hypothetical protein
MFKINLYGKISCTLGAPSFVLCLLAKYSEQNLLLDIDRPLLSPIINFLRVPIGYINRWFLSDGTPKESTLTAFDGHHIFESEAVTICFAVGLVLSACALLCVTKAVLNNESSIWFANGAFASIVALGLFSPYLGVVTAIVFIVMRLVSLFFRRTKK